MTTWFFAPSTGRAHAQNEEQPERTVCGARIGAQWKTVTPAEAARAGQCARCLQAVAPVPVVPPVVPSPAPQVAWYVLAGPATSLPGSVLHQRDPLHPHRMRCRRLLRALRAATPAEVAS